MLYSHKNYVIYLVIGNKLEIILCKKAHNWETEHKILISSSQQYYYCFCSISNDNTRYSKER